MIAVVIVIVVVLAIFLIKRRIVNPDKDRRPESCSREQDTPFPMLLKTGDESFDQHCARAWDGECYDNLSMWYVKKIAMVDDWQTTPEELELLRVCRRNQILCHVLSWAVNHPEPENLSFNFMCINPSEPGCPYSERPQTLLLKNYFKNPDVIPCTYCTSEGRKYYCSVFFKING